MPNTFPIIVVVRMGYGFFDQRTHGCRHGDMDTGEVLRGNLRQVAGGGVDQDTVGNGLGAGVNGNDRSAVERVAGLVDNVAGLRNRIAG